MEFTSSCLPVNRLTIYLGVYFKATLPCHGALVRQGPHADHRPWARRDIRRIQAGNDERWPLGGGSNVLGHGSLSTPLDGGGQWHVGEDAQG
jgi:hypothetical protein